MNAHRQRQFGAIRSQRGVMLLEALVGILVFSIGVVALLGLQGISMKNVGDSKYRTDAAMLANQLIGDIVAGPKDTAYLTAHYAAGGDLFTAWNGTVSNALPGGSGTIAITKQTWAGTVSFVNKIVLTVNWTVPGDTTIHSYTTTTMVNSTVSSASSSSSVSGVLTSW